VPNLPNRNADFFRTEIPSVPEPLDLESCTFRINKDCKKVLNDFADQHSLSRDTLIEAVAIFLDTNSSPIIQGFVIPEAQRRTKLRSIHRSYKNAKTFAKKLPIEDL
jgi:hypothetical protein